MAGRRIASLPALLDELSHRLAVRPVRATWRRADGIETAITIDDVDLASYFWRLCGDTRGIASAPGRLWRVAQGDYADLAADAAKARHLGAGGLDAYSLAFGGTAMPDALEAEVYRLDAGPAPYLNRLHEAGCEYPWPISRDARPPFEQRVPVTYVMGEWDVRTPLEGLEDVRRDADTVVVNPCQGHDSAIDGDGGPVWEVPIIRAFLEGATPPARPAPAIDFGAGFR